MLILDKKKFKHFLPRVRFLTILHQRFLSHALILNTKWGLEYPRSFPYHTKTHYLKTFLQSKFKCFALTYIYLTIYL